MTNDATRASAEAKPEISRRKEMDMNGTGHAAAEPEGQSLWSRLDDVETNVYEARSLAHLLFSAITGGDFLQKGTRDGFQTCLSDLQSRLDEASSVINDTMNRIKEGGVQ